MSRHPGTQLLKTTRNSKFEFDKSLVLGPDRFWSSDSRESGRAWPSPTLKTFNHKLYTKFSSYLFDEHMWPLEALGNWGSTSRIIMNGLWHWCHWVETCQQKAGWIWLNNVGYFELTLVESIDIESDCYFFKNWHAKALSLSFGLLLGNRLLHHALGSWAWSRLHLRPDYFEDD